MQLNKKTKVFLWVIGFVVLLFVFLFYIKPSHLFQTIEYSEKDFLEVKDKESLVEPEEKIAENKEAVVTPDLLPVTHIQTPEKVKAIYMSSWVAGSPSFRDSLVKLTDKTELNSIVIDIKDSTGRVSFPTDDPLIQKIGSSEKRISNIRSLTNLLHSKDIYIIGRISVFQDPYLAKQKPEWAITRKSDGGIWKDRKGLSFLDPTNKDVHEYILTLARYSYDQGFDEINFDYIRYPSDGNMDDINYKLKEGQTRADNIEAFFKHLSSEIKKDVNIPISADLFGLTTESTNDMGIGQVWEKALPYFDFVAPMVYPSHYPSGYAGYKNPATYPYEVVKRAMLSGVSRAKVINQDTDKIRPWLQDFDLGATYTKDMVRAQMRATYDSGLDSWMLWDPSNKYTPEALLLETN